MDLLTLPVINFPPLFAPLIETLLLAMALFVVALPLSGRMGWVLVTRRQSALMRWIAWGAVWSALLLPTRLVAEGVPLHWLTILDGRFALWFVLIFLVLPLGIFYAVRLFAVTAVVGRQHRYQMGFPQGVAPATVVRPLLPQLAVWVLGASLLVTLFDFGVAERFNLETLPVMLYTLDHPISAQLLQWVLLLLFSVWMVVRTYRKLPYVEQEKVDQERIRTGGGAYLVLLLISLLYIPVGIVLGQFLHG